ncbi:MAG: hypothetical protein KKD44_07050 [Proteobacteria bacterium]|nr:hypothetical protein [Pseudomonadota bacterium]
MKKLARLGLIGVLHATVYLWLLPHLILPRFGSLGSKITVGVLIVLSVIILTSAFVKKKKP